MKDYCKTWSSDIDQYEFMRKYEDNIYNGIITDEMWPFIKKHTTRGLAKINAHKLYLFALRSFYMYALRYRYCILRQDYFAYQSFFNISCEFERSYNQNSFVKDIPDKECREAYEEAKIYIALEAGIDPETMNDHEELPMSIKDFASRMVVEYAIKYAVEVDTVVNFIGWDGLEKYEI